MFIFFIFFTHFIKTKYVSKIIIDVLILHIKNDTCMQQMIIYNNYYNKEKQNVVVVFYLLRNTLQQPYNKILFCHTSLLCIVQFDPCKPYSNVRSYKKKCLTILQSQMHFKQLENFNIL